MAGFVRRFTEYPSTETLLEIEGVDIVDIAPAAPTTGVGSGTVLLVGEFEDGPFAAPALDATLFGEKDAGPQEVFGSEDFLARFGGFGFTYGGVVSSNPCARKHVQELWNGNGFIKAKYLRANRLILARVDTSVGEVAISPLACIKGGAGTYALAVGQTLSITTSQGGPAVSDAIAAAVATAAGAGFTSPTTFVGGETIGIRIDGGPQVNVVFSAADQLVADVVATINTALGYTAAVVNVGEADISGIIPGTDGSVELIDVTPGTLAVIGHVVGTSTGTGNVGNVNAVTAAEVATILNGTVALTAIGVVASVDAAGLLSICDDAASVGTILVAAGAMATALELDPIGTVVAVTDHLGGKVAAGTRVRDGASNEWVTMQTLTIAAGHTGPWVVKVRPATDDGLTGVSALAAAVTTLVDQPSFTDAVVTNPAALSAPKDEVAMDVAYEAAFDATLDPKSVCQTANHSLCARRSDVVATKGRQNAIDASQNDMYGRKFHTGTALGISPSDAIAEVASYRRDRVFYTALGLKVRIPEIAARGTAGGLGFTADGIITVRPDGPLCTLNARLNPEENPGQETGLIEDFFEVDTFGNVVSIETYKAFKAAGICAPRIDRTSGTIFQSGVTTDLTSGRTTQARRKMADFIQDTAAERLKRYSKKLNKQSRRDGARGEMESFLSGLLSADNPELQRIDSYAIDERSGNSPDRLALGIFTLIMRVRTLSSLDAIVIQAEVGENTVVVTEV